MLVYKLTFHLRQIEVSPFCIHPAEDQWISHWFQHQGTDFHLPKQCNCTQYGNVNRLPAHFDHQLSKSGRKYNSVKLIWWSKLTSDNSRNKRKHTHLERTTPKERPHMTICIKKKTDYRKYHIISDSFNKTFLRITPKEWQQNSQCKVIH